MKSVARMMMRCVMPGGGKRFNVGTFSRQGNSNRGSICPELAAVGLLPCPHNEDGAESKLQRMAYQAQSDRLEHWNNRDIRPSAVAECMLHRSGANSGAATPNLVPPPSGHQWPPQTLANGLHA
jgi:hypothetical protein